MLPYIFAATTSFYPSLNQLHPELENKTKSNMGQDEPSSKPDCVSCPTVSANSHEQFPPYLLIITFFYAPHLTDIVLVPLLTSLNWYLLIWLISICPYFASWWYCCHLFQAPFLSIYIAFVPLAPFSTCSTPATPVSHPIFIMFYWFYLPSLHFFFPFAFPLQPVPPVPVSILSTHPTDLRMDKAKATRKNPHKKQNRDDTLRWFYFYRRWGANIELVTISPPK